MHFIHLNGQEIPNSKFFLYPRLIAHKDEEKEEEINHKIIIEWMKWKSTLEVLCEHRIPITLNRKFYKNVIRPFALNGIECWLIKKQHVHEMSVSEIRMLR